MHCRVVFQEGFEAGLFEFFSSTKHELVREFSSETGK
jgi:hypothetical protein